MQRLPYSLLMFSNSQTKHSYSFIFISLQARNMKVPPQNSRYIMLKVTIVKASRQNELILNQ